MGLESGTRVTDLVTTNPTATDLRSQGDDHLRLIKTCVQNDLANVLGARAVQSITVATGAITPAALSSAIINLTGESSLADDLDTITATNKYSGNLVMLKGADAANPVTVRDTGGGTGNIRLLRAKSAVLNTAGEYLILWYDGTNWNEITRGDLSEVLDGDTLNAVTITSGEEITLGAAAAPTALDKGLAIAGSTAPSANLTDGIALTAIDENGAGTRWPQVRTETGDVINLVGLGAVDKELDLRPGTSANANRAVRFASDASILWDEAADQFTLDKNLGVAQVIKGTGTDVQIMESTSNSVVMMSGTLAAIRVIQQNAAGAIPPLGILQSDVSEPLIYLSCTIGAGNGIQAEANHTPTAGLTHYLKVHVAGVGDRYIALTD